MSEKHNPEVISSGVDSLIGRLREEGVSAGQKEAEKIISGAKTEARGMVEKAEAEAKSVVEAARKQADGFKAAGEDALKVAMRDTVLGLKSGLMQRFSNDMRRLVSDRLQEKELLKQIVLEVAGRVTRDANISEDEPLEVILPAEAVGLEELRQRPEELEKGKLTGLTLGLTDELLREGVSFSASEDLKSGIHIRLVDKDITVDLTDEAVATLILQHLQPRFRAILEGVVK